MEHQVKRNPQFVMEVRDVFSFADGRTVFVGEVADGIGYITTCECALLIDEVEVATFLIEGEMLPLNSAHPNLRSVSTKAKVDVEEILRAKGRNVTLLFNRSESETNASPRFCGTESARPK